LSTLIKASPKRSNGVGCLEEPFIIPIAREVAVALKYVHETGVIHRDIKCANILVTEDGRIQLCDFGVSGMLENRASKRTTIIGTPHWMAPELVPFLGSDTESIQYGTEIDCWAFGCAVFEMATGFPPNHRIRVPELRMRRDAPRLEGDDHSDELKDFVAFCLQEVPENRPTAAQIIEHQYIKDTDENYPTKRIQNLIERFAVWEESGNQRESLFNPYGAQGPGETLEEDVSAVEWNFSTSVDFQKRMSMGLDPFGRGKDGDVVPAWQKQFEELRVQRGGDAMKGIFNIAAKPYTFGDADGYDVNDRRISDLPLRNFGNGPAENRTTMIDLNMALDALDEGPSLDLDNVPTIRARRGNPIYDEEDDDLYDTNRISTRFNENQNPNRATMEWTFPGVAAAAAPPSIAANKNPNRATMEWSFNNAQQEATARKSTMFADMQQADFEIASPSPGRPGLIHSKTMPADPFRASEHLSVLASSPDRHSLIDLDSALSIDIPKIQRPPTADSIAESAVTDRTSGDPFDLETELPMTQNNRGSLHMKSQSEPTAAFQMSKQVRAVHDLINGEGAGAHNRSSSMNPLDVIGQSPAKRRWQGQSGESFDAGLQPAWDPFADADADADAEEIAREERRGWEKKLGHRRKTESSLSSNYTSTSSQESGYEALSILKPQARSMAMFDPSMRLKRPRPPNMGVLLPNANGRMMEEELAIVFGELGHQADTMISLLNSLMLEEEGSDVSSSANDAISGEAH
jgi:protein-serine/threonine kinase